MSIRDVTATAPTDTTVGRRTAPRLARPADQDPSVAILEAGLCAVILTAPLPFGSVGPSGRLWLEILALSLTVLWALIAATRDVILPPRAVSLALLGLLIIPVLQLVPVGTGAIAAL